LADIGSAKIDLHAHTTASDGDSTPACLVELAQRRGIKTLAITDHDTTRGYELAAKLPTDTVQLVAGVEITTRFQDRETHLLAYFFDPSNRPLQNLLARNRDCRRARFYARVESMNRAGFRIDLKNLDDEPLRALGRRHLAKHLVQSGQSRSLTEAFHKDLRLPEADYERLPVIVLPIEEAIAIVHQAEGVTSLAHPRQEIDLEELQLLKGFGLDALECECSCPNFDFPLALFGKFCTLSRWRLNSSN
jgi:predicted metal-dependent phosphoesterase TrpH